MNERVDADALDFEFERKFLVKSLPDEVTRHGSHQVIAQAYLFAHDGYAVRVRLSSLEPRTVDARFCDVLSGFANLMPHFHLSLQSGCNATLRRVCALWVMARKRPICISGPRSTPQETVWTLSPAGLICAGTMPLGASLPFHPCAKASPM